MVFFTRIVLADYIFPSCLRLAQQSFAVSFLPQLTFCQRMVSCGKCVCLREPLTLLWRPPFSLSRTWMVCHLPQDDRCLLRVSGGPWRSFFSSLEAQDPLARRKAVSLSSEAMTDVPPAVNDFSPQRCAFTVRPHRAWRPELALALLGLFLLLTPRSALVCVHSGKSAEGRAPGQGGRQREARLLLLARPAVDCE